MEKGNKLQQPIRITLAIAMWALILWVLTLNIPSFLPIARAIFIVFVIPSGLVEWLKYKGLVGKSRSMMVKIAFMVAAALIWYWGYR